ETMSRPPPQLNYAPIPPPWHQRRQTRGALLASLVVIALCIGGQTAWKAFKRHQIWQDLLTRQKACLEYSPPPNEIVFDADPADFDKLLKNGPSYQLAGGNGWPRYVQSTPAVWRQFTEAPFAGSTGILFLHARQTPA